MDLNQFAMSDKSRMPIRSLVRGPGFLEPILDDDGKEMYIELKGVDSPEYRRAMFNYKQSLIKQGKSEEDVDVFIQSESVTVEVLTAVTTGWNIQIDGKKPKFSPERVREFYSDPKFMFVREQVDEWVTNRRNFIMASKKDS